MQFYSTVVMTAALADIVPLPEKNTNVKTTNISNDVKKSTSYGFLTIFPIMTSFTILFLLPFCKQRKVFSF